MQNVHLIVPPTLRNTAVRPPVIWPLGVSQPHREVTVSWQLGTCSHTVAFCLGGADSPHFRSWELLW